MLVVVSITLTLLSVEGYDRILHEAIITRDKPSEMRVRVSCPICDDGVIDTQSTYQVLDC